MEKKLNKRLIPHIGALLSRTRPRLGSFLCTHNLVELLILVRILGTSRTAPTMLVLFNTSGAPPTRVTGTLMVFTRAVTVLVLVPLETTTILLSRAPFRTWTPSRALPERANPCALAVQFRQEKCSLALFLGSATSQKLQGPAAAFRHRRSLTTPSLTNALEDALLAIHLSTANPWSMGPRFPPLPSRTQCLENRQSTSLLPNIALNILRKGTLPVPSATPRSTFILLLQTKEHLAEPLTNPMNLPRAVPPSANERCAPAPRVHARAAARSITFTRTNASIGRQLRETTPTPSSAQRQR